ncbi:rhamnogalacturonan acetylesterase [Caulobacter endophyticus]|uniref:rhamnogalacturonan acetylesterase n=1 Tax=Caulobacter endophyticus TaxID=2172652 RepID=UPI0024100D85|nr:rhamnogalacturonan acetylesterase [Caulobacter endophyticus]MDG2531199.1 rhamnogalacturonan acetylesterase [Caulobacter endophyticus]
MKSLLLAAVLATAPLVAHAQAPEAEPPMFRAVKIVLIGDSTTAVIGGWGPSFCGQHLTSFAACINLARGGRSSGNYRTEGSWRLAMKEIGSGGFTDTYVLIQFGHNDQPGKPGRSTDLATEYPANLKRYVEEVRAAGGKPVLVTPLTRRQFQDGKLIDDLAPWAEATRKVAAETKTPLVDLHAKSYAAVQAMGAAEATRFAQQPPPAEVLAAARTGTTISAQPATPATPGAAPAPAAKAQNNAAVEPMGQAKLSFDYTHLGRDGADYFSKIVTDELAVAVPALRRYLVP